MSDIGKIPNPLNPANDPKKDTANPLDSSQYGRKFDYRKQGKTASGRNKQPFSQEEEKEPSKTKETEKTNPDSIFTPSSSGKSSFSTKKNAIGDKKELSFSPKKALEQQESIKEIREEEQNEVVLSSPVPESSLKHSSHEKPLSSLIKPHEKKKEDLLAPEPILTNIQQNQETYSPPVLPTGSGFTSYPISLLFDRMVGTITVMDSSGIKTTEFMLSGEEFASSVFYGARITITEYSTAPKAFNVQLSANPEAVALLQGSMPNLLANFESGKYAFRIHRLDTSVLEERPLFKRKGSSGSDQQPMQGGP